MPSSATPWVTDGKGVKQHFSEAANTESRVDLLRKVTFDLAIDEDDLDQVIEIIRSAARTGAEGQIGDGKIFVLPVADMISV